MPMEFHPINRSPSPPTPISGGTVTAVTGTPPISSTGGTTPDISHDATAVTPGTYASANVTVDQKGHITDIEDGSPGGGFAPIVFPPFLNEAPASNPATADLRNKHPTLDFDGSTDEEAVWSHVLRPGYAGGWLRVSTWWSFTSATSGSLRVQAAIERINTSSLDIDADSFAAFRSTDGTAPSTSGQVIKTDITFFDSAQRDGLTAGELFRLKIRRDADGTSGTDDITTDAELLMVSMVEVTPTDIPTDGLVLWIKADSENTYSPGDPVTTAHDRSGLANDFSGTGGAASPTWEDSGVTIGGLPVFQFDGAQSFRRIQTSFDSSAWSAATVFLVLRNDLDPPVDINFAGLCTFNPSNDATHHPYTDTAIYNGMYTTARKSVGNPSPSLASPYYITVISTAGDWRERLNGTIIFSTATNTFQGVSNPLAYTIFGNTGASAYFFQGVMGEWIIYNTVLSAADIDIVEYYLANKWGI